MKNSFLKLFFIGLMFLSFFSCKKTKTDDKVNLQLFHYKQEIVTQLNEIVAIFKEKYPNITIETETIPNDAQTVLKTKLTTGDAPDIMMLQSYSTVFEYAKAGYLLNLSDEEFMSRVFQGALNAVRYDNKLYALPMDVAGIGIIYNKEIFENNNITIPTTFNELKTVCETLKKNGITPFAVSIKDNWPLGHFYSMGHTAAIGNKLNNWITAMDQGISTFKSKEMDSVFGVFDFYKQNADPKANEKNYENQKTDFASGKYAMMVQGLWAYGQGSKNINPNLKAGFFPFPFTNDPEQTKLYADTDSTFAISASSSPEKIEAAKKFLDFMTSPEGVKLWTEKCGLVPTVKGATVDKMDEPYQDLVKYMSEGKTMPWGFSMWPTVVFEESKKTMQEYYNGQKTKEEVMDYLTSLWKKAKGIK